VATALLFAWGTLPCGAQTVEPLPDSTPSIAGPTVADPLATQRIEAKPFRLDGFEGDGRRTMSAFPKNLGRNFVGVFPEPAAFAAGAVTSVSRPSTTRRRTCSAQDWRARVGGAAMVPVVMLLVAGARPQGFRAMTYDWAGMM
jgi:hypothetical protein